MKKIKKLVIIGHFGGNENYLDGQTIKTKILYNELLASTKWKIKKVDTYYKSRKPLKLLFQSLYALFTTKNIIILLSGNGMKFYFPILRFFSKVFRTNIYHDVIGGNLDNYVRKYPKYKGYLNSFKINWVETNSMKKKLEDLGVNNCAVLPNFKRLNINEIFKKDFIEPYKYCTFSRVMKEKGIEDAINAIENINKRYGKVVCALDIYGKVDEAYKERFDKVMSNVSSNIQYCGLVSYDKSVEAISNYYALLFPTYWDGEGFPGTIIDAFSAGLPVIATDWNCNSEIIIDMINGILYPNDNFKTLEDAIYWSIENKEKFNEMRKACVISAKNYQPDNHIEKIIKFIQNK